MSSIIFMLIPDEITSQKCERRFSKRHDLKWNKKKCLDSLQSNIWCVVTTTTLSVASDINTRACASRIAHRQALQRCSNASDGVLMWLEKDFRTVFLSFGCSRCVFDFSRGCARKSDREFDQVGRETLRPLQLKLFFFYIEKGKSKSFTYTL